MNIKNRWVAGAMAACVCFTMAGCQTYGEGAGAGAAVGALAGGIIGNQSGNALAGAAIGAAAGALVGVVAHDIKETRAKNRAQTVETYKYQPSQGEVLQIEDATVTPQVARPGAMVTSSLQYAIIGGSTGTPVTETRSIVSGERVIANVSSKKFTREDGTWLTTQDFKVPDGLKPGQYSLIQKVETPQSSVFMTTNFTVQ